jgi:hypothetical protein
MIPTALSGRQIRRCKQSIHLGLFQVCDQCSRGLFERHGPHVTGPLNQLWSVLTDEPRQSVDSSRALIARGNFAAPLVFLFRAAASVLGMLILFLVFAKRVLIPTMLPMAKDAWPNALGRAGGQMAMRAGMAQSRRRNLVPN